jgi:hypothetical protein
MILVNPFVAAFLVPLTITKQLLTCFLRRVPEETATLSA